MVSLKALILVALSGSLVKATLLQPITEDHQMIVPNPQNTRSPSDTEPLTALLEQYTRNPATRFSPRETLVRLHSILLLSSGPITENQFITIWQNFNTHPQADPLLVMATHRLSGPFSLRTLETTVDQE